MTGPTYPTVYPDLAVRYRVTGPGQDESVTDDPPLLFDRSIDAWRHAAHQVLGVRDEPDDADRVTVARSLLEMDQDGDVMYGWVVSRWAMTLMHPRTRTHQLAARWSAHGMSVLHHDGMDDTFADVVRIMVQSLITDFAYPDVAVLDAKQVTVGVAASVDDDGVVTFVDGQCVGLATADQVWVVYP